MKKLDFSEDYKLDPDGIEKQITAKGTDTFKIKNGFFRVKLLSNGRVSIFYGPVWFGTAKYDSGKWLLNSNPKAEPGPEITDDNLTLEGLIKKIVCAHRQALMDIGKSPMDPF